MSEHKEASHQSPPLHDLEAAVLAADDTGMLRNEADIATIELQAAIEIPAANGSPK